MRLCGVAHLQDGPVAPATSYATPLGGVLLAPPGLVCVTIE